MSNVFISYSHKDAEYAHKLADEMKRCGINVWIDDRIDYGDQWPTVIQDNLERCAVVIVIMSSNSFTSKWVNNEVAFAQYANKIILPLLLEGKLWVSLASTQYADIRGGKMPPDSFFNTVRKYLGAGAVEPLPKQEIQSPQKSEVQILLERKEKQRLGDKIFSLFKSAVQNNKPQKWSIGIFKVEYLYEGRYEPNLTPRTPNSRLLPKQSFIIPVPLKCEMGGSIGNESLLSQYDPKIYAEYKAGLETISKKMLSSKSVSSNSIDPIEEIRLKNQFLQRLNLFFHEWYITKPDDSRIEKSAEKLIQIHESHHIPISVIEIKGK
jgi:hypothetical protein